MCMAFELFQRTIALWHGRQSISRSPMAQLQHNMWVTNAKAAALSIITGGGKWVEISIPADCLYQHLLLTAEKKFWRCVESGEPPRLYGAEPTTAADRSGAHRRYECIQFLGRIGGGVLPN